MKDLMSKAVETATETMEGLPAKLKLGLEKVGQFTENAKEKSAEYIDQLIELSPIIEEIGFKTNSISLSVGITPSAQFQFEKFKEVNPQTQQAILDKHEGKMLLVPLVKAILMADDCQRRIKMGSFKLHNIEIHLGLSPSVSLLLKPVVHNTHVS